MTEDGRAGATDGRPAAPADDVAPRASGGLRVMVVTRGVLPLGPRAGGAERVAARLAVTLAGEGHEVVLVSDVEEPIADLPGSLRIAPVRSHTPWLERLPSRFSRWIAQHLAGNVLAARAARRELAAAGDRPFDAVHVHGALAAILLARSPRPAVLVYTEHDATPWSCRYRHWWEHAIRVAVFRSVNLRACRAADAVSTPFPNLATELAARSRMPRDHFRPVANAVDLRPVSPAATEQDPCLAELLRLEGFDPYVVFVGSLTDRKGPDVLLRALVGASVRCVFVGDGPMRARLEALAGVLGVAGRVRFVGALPTHRVLDLCDAADALVLPSFAEALPLVILEAFSCGTPVVATDVAGIPSVVRDGETGLLVPPGDARRLAEALELVTFDGELRQALGKGAAALADDHLDYAGAAGRYVELYRELALAGDVPSDG